MVQELIYSPVADLGIGLLYIIMAVVLLIIVMALTPSKTDLYRKDLVNMYIASRTRQLATEQKLDINDEYDNFKKWAKKRSMDEKTLSSAIESELKEKVMEDHKKSDTTKKES